MQSIDKHTTNEWLTAADQHILYTTNRPAVIMERGEGMYLWDTEGKCYLDFIGGWAVTCLGHAPKAIEKALIEQAGQLINASPAFYNVPMIAFAKMLTELTCFDKVFFTTSGSEANEGAIKLARKYGQKYLGGAYEIITTVNSFHGRTLATMSATGKDYWEPLFAPKVSGFIHVPFNDIEAIKAAITDKTCAIMLEPVQGEGGVNVADPVYVKAVRKICDAHNILLIFDEVQTGMGRTGKMFAYEHYDIEPDIMTLAKGIGGGYPLSAMLTKAAYNIFDAGDQGGTYTAQPLGMAVGMAVLETIVKEKIVENTVAQGAYLMECLNAMGGDYGIKSVRGMGLLIAFDLPEPKGAEVVAACLEKGLLINSPKPATIRLMPPLIVTREAIDSMLKTMTEVLASVLK
ncbi:MAG: acetylornithine/N-succinyldiaminopimelate aminotransferase [Clostridiales bacterium]|jgi:acetylornithine/N-succinyldiaminopimelate aminotransferase|nr:acetylornithine/N-succinyldiaminopimelate aminotransferase [Clostridiales bacterium]MDN5298106.1 acetylornithine/N-succinyldiaminopimelate aminotransferase [Clostridiales bacterium]